MFRTETETKQRTAGRIRQKNERIILRAAEIEFANSGFKGASMNDIAMRAELPKANIHYYFKNKLGLYVAVLSDILELWDASLNSITAKDDPRAVLTDYIARKVRFSRRNPLASRIFANEIIGGAHALKEYFGEDYQQWFEGRVAVFREWARDGRIDPQLDPAHIIFMIWACTQHYADFQVQISAALGKPKMSDDDYDTATDTLTQVILRGCGIQ